MGIGGWLLKILPRLRVNSMNKKLKAMVDNAMWPYKNWEELHAGDKVQAVIMATIWIGVPLTFIGSVLYKIFN